MVLTGVVVLLFLIYHLLHFTFGVIDADHTRLFDAGQRLDVYSSVVQTFRNPWIAGSYVVSMVLLGFHLWHGTTSAFQTLGVRHESYETLLRVIAALLVAALVLGNSSIPILIYAGRVGI